MESWNERLRAAMNRKGLSAADLVRATGISGAGIKKWIDGVTVEPKYRDVTRACQALDISPIWLMEGRGESVPLKPSETAIIDKVDLKGSCGYGTINFDQVPQIQRLMVSKRWFQRHFSYYKPDTVKVITALGDSMTPDVNDGDAVFIDISDTEFIRDGIYAALVDDELYIKRIQKAPGKLIFISTNPAYKPFEISIDGPSTVKFIGRVIKSMCFKDL